MKEMSSSGFRRADRVEIGRRDHYIGVPWPLAQPHIQCVVLAVLVGLVQGDALDAVADAGFQRQRRIRASVLEGVGCPMFVDHGTRLR